MSKRVLVLCTGNICRSPYAEQKLRDTVPELLVTSAGLATKKCRLQGKPADSLAVRVGAKFGVDITRHKAKQVTQQLVDESDLILVMDNRQLETLCNEYSGASHKSHLFGQLIGVDSIDDPYKQGAHAFRVAYTLIDRSIEVWVTKI